MEINPELLSHSVAIPYPVGSPDGNYLHIWAGARFGGKLYITMHESSTSRIYFALLDIPGELPVVGHFDINVPEGMKVFEVMENILAAIELAYVEHSNMIYKGLIKNNSVRIQ